MLSVQSVEHSVSTITYKLPTMSGNTATATTAIAPVANQSVVVQRLCEMFGKNYDEVSAAIQSEMTAMEQELQCWKLQMSDRAATTTTTVESKTKKAPRAKKSEAVAESNAAAAAVAAVESDAPPADAHADAATKTKKAPRAKKAAAEKPAVVVDSVPTESNDIVVVAEPAAASSASEPKAKKPAAPRAKKAAATVESGSESDASVAPAPAPAPAATAVESKAKKPAAPRAKKADKSAVASAAAADTVAPADEQKAKKAPRAKKVAAADKPIEVVAQQVDEVVDTNVDDDAESVFEEIEIEVVEFTFDGVKYLRSKNDDNTVYDPETSDVIGKWNEETGCIDAE